MNLPAELPAAADGDEEASTEARRRKVYLLWLRGVSQMQMAESFHVDRRTIQRDIEAIEERLLGERLPSLEGAIAKSLGVYREVLQAAWLTHDRAPDNSTNKVGALNTILLAQAKVDELEGVSAPEKATAAALAEVYSVLGETLAEVDPEMRRQFLLRLAQKTRPSLLGRSIVPSIAAEG